MKRLIFILLSMVSTVAYAQSLQTYSGDYDAIYHNGINPYGRANYTYYLDSLGNRIYHGNFSYTDKSHTLKGAFKDDKQDGLWKYTHNSLYGNLTISITFSDGIVNGPISIKLYNNKKNMTVAYFNASVLNGNIVGEVDILPHHIFDKVYTAASEIYSGNTTGSFNTDGLPIGKWKCKNRTHELVENYSGDNIILDYRNVSTGDKIVDLEAYGIRIPYLPNIAINIINNALAIIRCRSTPVFTLPKFEFLHLADDFSGSLNYFDGDGEWTTMRINDARNPTKNISYDFRIVERIQR